MPSELATLPGLAAHACTAIRLHPRHGEPRLRESHIGGPLLWPANEPWPVCGSAEAHEMPNAMVAVAQLRRIEFPELPYPGETDLLQILWCPCDHAEFQYGPAVQLRWRSSSAVGEPLDSPPAPELAAGMYLPRRCVLHPERVVEFPWWQEIPEELGEALRGHTREVIAPGWKAAGCASWAVTDLLAMDCPSCGRRMSLLFTADSCEGHNERWIPWEESHIVRDGSQDWRDIDEPTGVQVGRYGALRIFVCPSCPDRPFRCDIQ